MKLTSLLISSLLVVGLVGWTGCEDQRVGTEPVAPDAQPAGETTPPADPTVTEPGVTEPGVTDPAAPAEPAPGTGVDTPPATPGTTPPPQQPDDTTGAGTPR